MGRNSHLLRKWTLLINSQSTKWRVPILLALCYLNCVLSVRADLFMGAGTINVGRNAATATLLPNGKVLLTGGYNFGAGGYLANAELYDPATGNWTTINPMITARYQHTATLLSSGLVLVAGGEGPYSGTLSSAELYNPTTGNWSATPNMPGARKRHTATLLPNGKVLVAAGQWGDPAIATVALYNPANNTWAAANSMGMARFGHTATLLPNGKVLLAAGWNNAYLNSAELYDYTTGNWTPTTYPMTGARYEPSAALLPNGNVLVSGGWDGCTYLATAEVYNPTVGTWTQTTSMTAARNGHTSTPLANGKVLIVAGYGPSGTYGYLDSAELYDWVTGWSSAGSIPTAREGHTATALGDGKVLIAGGYNYNNPFAMDASVYVPSVSTWTLAQQMSLPREFHSANLLPVGKVLVVGGWSSSGPTATAELYNHLSGSWEPTLSMPAPRYSHTATTLPHLGWTLVTGGYDNNGVLLASTIIYKPFKSFPVEAASWMTVQPMTYARHLHTATLLPYSAYNKVLVTGGSGVGGSILSSAEIFDLTFESWSPAGSGVMNVARYSHTATWLPSGKVLIAGGVTTGGGILYSAELYDSSGNSWSSAPQMSIQRHSHTATLLANGKVLIAGGRGSGESILSSCVLYDPSGGPSGSWSPAPPMLSGRYYHTATLLPDAKVLVTGGLCGAYNTPCAEIYDPSGSGSWTPTGSLNNGRYDHTATALPNGKVLVAGGAPASYMPIASAEVYGPLLANPASSGGRTVTSIYYASLGTQYYPRYVNPTSGYSINRRLNLSAFISSLPSTGWGFNSDSVPINGVLKVPSGAGPFPLAIFAHGKYPDPFEDSELGHNYLCDLLASWGILAASIDANFFAGGSACSLGEACPDIGARAILHLEHVRQFKIWNETPGHALYGKVDLSKIMIVGHSRGGEAAAHASAFNSLSSIVPQPGQAAVPLDGSVGLGPYGFTLKAVVGIAPTDRFIPVAGETKVRHNYFLIHASRDEDIHRFEGYRTYDRAHPIDLNNPTQDAAGFKALLWCVGGNHNYFNEIWEDNDASIPLLLEPHEQRQIAKVYISALAQTTLLGRSEYLEVFKNHAVAKDWLPAGKDFISQYQDPKRLFIDHYEEDRNRNTLSPPNVGQNIWPTTLTELFFDGWQDMYQQTWGAELVWNAPGQVYRASIAGAGINGGLYAYLGLRIGQSAWAENPPGQDQNFRMVLYDASGASASFTGSAFSRMLYPDTNKYGVRKIVMQTFRIPLSLFRGRNLNMNNISGVELVFDQVNSGRVYFDELQLSN
jgi:N-acetylneuraminic acid mutarotase